MQAIVTVPLQTGHACKDEICKRVTLTAFRACHVIYKQADNPVMHQCIGVVSCIGTSKSGLLVSSSRTTDPFH